MSRTFSLLLFSLGVFVFTFSVAYTTTAAVDYYLLERNRPCRTPIAYSIGLIDPRFHVSKEVVSQELATTSKVWSDVLKRPLFTEVQSGGVRVHFVFDKRQELTLKDLSLKKSRDYISAQSAKLDTEEKDLGAAKLALKKRETQLIARGNLTYDEFEEMNRENRRIQKRNEQLEKDEKVFNAFVDAYNIAAKTLEKQMPKGAIVQGEYYDDERGNKSIKVFSFASRSVMREILAHEFGHALTLGHIPDAKSIMHKNSAGILTPSPKDIEALTKACKLDFWTYLSKKWKS